MSQNAVQKFTEALEDWQEANRDYHKARAGYDGYSPDYHLYHEIEAMRRATAEMQAAFYEAVREAVAAMMAEKP